MEQIGILGEIQVDIVDEERIGRIVWELVGSFVLELGEILGYMIAWELFDRIGLEQICIFGLRHLLLKQ